MSNDDTTGCDNCKHSTLRFNGGVGATTCGRLGERGSHYVGVDMSSAGDSMVVVIGTPGRTAIIDPQVAGLAAGFQRGDMPLVSYNALTRWIEQYALDFDQALLLGRALGLDDEHAFALAKLAGFTPITRVRFEVDGDEDATRVASVLGALGFTPIRVVATLEHRNRWALGELLRLRKLTPSEHGLAAAALGRDAKTNRHAQACLDFKIGGKTIEQAVAEVAEARS